MAYSFDMSGILSGLEGCETKAMQAIVMLAETEAKNFEKDAKEKAKWTDRTGHARQRLQGYVTRPGKGVVRINLAHGVDYGLWLELAHEKRFAIVEPTVRLKGPEAIKHFERLMDRL